jgi:hypothetical protein
VHLRAPDPPAALARAYEDIDLVAPRKARRDVEAAFAGLGLVPEREFNALQGSRRQIWWTADGATHVDVFLGEFAMCHRLDLDDRLDGDHAALPAADLLLTKLQVVELTLKDVQDAARLLASHDLAEDDAPGHVSLPRIRAVLGADWGFHTTVSDNLERLPALVAEQAPEVASVVAERAGALRAAADEGPKTRAWRLRAKVGRRRRWYDTPEESLPA